MSLEDGPTDESMQIDASFPCPYCGRQCDLSIEQAGILHVIPPCAKFLATSPEQLVHDASANMERLITIAALSGPRGST